MNLSFEFKFDFFFEDLKSWCINEKLYLNFNETLYNETRKHLETFLKLVKIYFNYRKNLVFFQDYSSMLVFFNLTQLISIRIMRLWFPFWFNDRYNMSTLQCNNVDFYVCSMLETNLVIHF